jgi:hypothetical protein
LTLGGTKTCEKQKIQRRCKAEDKVMVFMDQKLAQDAIKLEKNTRHAAKQVRKEKRKLEEQRQPSPETVREKVCKSISTEAHPGCMCPLLFRTRCIPNRAFIRKASPADRPGQL